MGKFNVLTDTPWEDFRKTAYAHMGLRRDDTLAYRQYHTISGTYDKVNDFSGCYGLVRPLLRVEDWEKAVANLCKAGEKFLDVEIELLVPVASVEVSSFGSPWAI